MGVLLTVPVTIVSGFLGSGKTTLVNRLLHELRGGRIAVIENEFGAVGVDAEFLARSGGETIVQLANGCLCCTVRGDFAKALERLLADSDAARYAFDRVLIETSGLADPGPVVQTFLAETQIRARFHLDGVATVIDALNFKAQTTWPENRAQVAFADRLLVGKCDLIDEAALGEVEQALATLNPRAPRICCDIRSAPIDELIRHIFDTRAFATDYVPVDELRRAREVPQLALATATTPTTAPAAGLAPATVSHSHGVGTFVFVADRPLDLAKLNMALAVACRKFGDCLWRCKGIADVAGHRTRIVVQGVRQLVQLTHGTLWRPFERRSTTLVFIGQSLDRKWLQDLLHGCLVDDGTSDCKLSLHSGVPNNA